MKNYQGGIKKERTEDLDEEKMEHSNVIRIGEEDTTKRKKVTITSSKKTKQNKTEKQRKQTKESSGPSCQPTSRWAPQ